MSTNNTSVLGIGVLGRMILGNAGGGLHLITDRTIEDVLAGNKKGSYGAEDLNRVGEAILYVVNRLRASGNDIMVAPKTDWTREDIPTNDQMAYYLKQVEAVRSALAVYQTTPLTPNDMVDLSHSEANNIEKILVDVDQLITNMMAAYFYSGDLYGGEV